MLTTHQLTYQYKGAAPLHFPDLACAANEHWLLLGSSGSGKTTLLNLLAGLLRPASGKIELAGTDMTTLSTAAMDRFRGKQIGMVFQKAHFIRSVSVIDNILLAQSMAGITPNRPRAQALLAELDIADKARKSVDQLSVGEQQRVAIARAVINQPPLLLADEPTSALDDENAERVLRLLVDQAQAVQATLIVVTHDNRLRKQFAKKVVLEKL